jgi:hypothetical protein
MLYQNILLPVFVLVALTFGVLFWTGRRLSLAGGPAAEGSFNYHLHTLFYVLVAYSLTLRQADLIMVLLAWVFVVIQVFHAGLFVRASDTRGSSFFIAGALVLLAMWVYFALHILFPFWW